MLSTKYLTFFLAIAVVALGVVAFNTRPDNEPDLDFAGIEYILQNEPEASTTPGALKVPIIIYHSVHPHTLTETKLQQKYNTTPELLEQQLSYLAQKGYTTITLNDLAHSLEMGTTSPVLKPVVLTFDDGWESQYRYAFPLLKKYHDTAAFYIYTNPIGTKPHFLTWDQIREMDGAGMTIADHTLSHPYLKHLSRAELEKEILGGKAVLEQELGKPVRHFASPFGYTSPLVRDVLQKAGFATGRTTYKGTYHTKDEQFALHGFLVGENMSDFINVLKR